MNIDLPNEFLDTLPELRGTAFEKLVILTFRSMQDTIKNLESRIEILEGNQ